MIEWYRWLGLVFVSHLRLHWMHLQDNWRLREKVQNQTHFLTLHTLHYLHLDWCTLVDFLKDKKNIYGFRLKIQWKQNYRFSNRKIFVVGRHSPVQELIVFSETKASSSKQRVKPSGVHWMVIIVQKSVNRWTHRNHIEDLIIIFASMNGIWTWKSRSLSGKVIIWNISRGK